jgi:S-(hydroxymethyl)glutathione dehydrogenase/alcohol dehydrogenase
MSKSPGQSRSLSRRRMLQTGAAAMAGAVAAGATAQAQAPGVLTGTQAGRRFRGWVQRTGAPNRGSLEELTLLPVEGRQVIVRNEAMQCCYSNVSRVLGTQDPIVAAGADVLPAQRLIHGHGGVGIVEAIGPAVRGISVGDRVVVAVTPECGRCYQCLRGRADRCQILRDSVIPFARTADGADVIGATNIGGHGELMGTTEEWCAPVFTDVPSVELATLHCVGGTGLGTTMTLSPVEPGSNVVIFGCGPIGLSAVQGARIMGANLIIAIEPARIRREMALRMGATHVFDPNMGNDELLEQVRELCAGASDDKFAGTQWRTGNNRGPDFIIEAVGGDRFTPTVEQGPDPQGILPLRQAFDLCPFGGSIATTGIAQDGDLVLPAQQWANGSKTHFSSQYGGTHLKRDIPRYVRLIERGLYDAASLVTGTYPLEQLEDAFQTVADRTNVAAVVTFEGA